MSQSKRWLLALLLGALVLTRLPFFSTSLCGEEGLFAHAIIEVAKGNPPRILVARDLEGRDYAGVPEHNLAGYVLPGLVLRAAAPVLGVDLESRDVAARIHLGRVIRAIMFCFYLLAVVIAFTLLPAKDRLRGSAAILGFSLLTFPLLSSVQIQYDGAISTLLLTSAVALSARALAQSRSDLIAAWAMGAGAIIALGKVEYLVAALGVAACGTLLDLRADRALRTPKSAAVRAGLFIGAWIGGVLLSSLACYLYDPANFIGGYEVLFRFGASTPSTWTARWHYILHHRKAMLLTQLGVLVFVGWVLKNRLRVPLAPALAGAAASAVTVGFGLAAWPGDGFPRYFAPAFLLLPVALVQLSVPRALGAVGFGVLAIMAQANYRHYLTRPETAVCSILQSGSLAAVASEYASIEHKCIPRAESALGFYAASSPFICCGYWDDVRRPEPLHTQLCP